MCVWVTTQYWTLCGCTAQKTQPKPGCSCTAIINQGTQVWEGYCNRSECPQRKA